MSMLGLELRKIFVQHKYSICSEPLRATLGWAPRGADMKQAVQGQVQPLPGNDSDHSRKSNTGKEDEGKAAET